MTIKRVKRWNGDLDQLTAAYLNNVIEKMVAYGENVQFSSLGSVDGPHYRVINTSGKKMSFDSSNMLAQPDESTFEGKSATLLTLEQIRRLLQQVNVPKPKTMAAKSRRVAGTVSTRGGTAVTRAKEQIALQKYEYYKTNREALPSDIREHSDEITRMMEAGVSAEEAFNEAVKLCFDH